MSIKLTPFIFNVIVLLLVSNQLAAQTQTGIPIHKDWKHSPRNCHHLLSNTSQCNWQFIEVKAGLEGTVIAWDQAPEQEKEITNVSVAILKTAKDTIRVLILNKGHHKPGDHIKITQGSEPAEDVAVPLDRDFYIQQERSGEKPICRINKYDTQILKTMWGNVVN